MHSLIQKCKCTLCHAVKISSFVLIGFRTLKTDGFDNLWTHSVFALAKWRERLSVPRCCKKVVTICDLGLPISWIIFADTLRRSFPFREGTKKERADSANLSPSMPEAKAIEWSLKCFSLRNTIIDRAEGVRLLRETHFQWLTLCVWVASGEFDSPVLSLLKPRVNMTLHKHIIDVVNATAADETEKTKSRVNRPATLDARKWIFYDFSHVNPSSLPMMNWKHVPFCWNVYSSGNHSRSSQTSNEENSRRDTRTFVDESWAEYLVTSPWH